MVVERTAIFGPGLAGCCTVLSLFGVVILVVLGAAFSAHVEVLTAGKEAPKDPSAVGRACYFAAVVYAGFVVFCGCQLGVNRRTVRGGEVRL